MPIQSPNAKTNSLDQIVRQELTKASQRIRFNDLLSGLLALSVVILGYAAVAIMIDQYLELPAWVRQLGLVGFLGAFVGVGYLVLWKPFRQVINPRYAARQVEATIQDAQNSLINWVDLQDENLPESVKAAVAARAADNVSEADLHKATESRRLLWLGAIAGLLLALLAGLFVAYKPNPFFSLINRAFNPFYAGKIANRTELLLRAPAEGNVTITSGEPLTVEVYVSGSVPEPDTANRLRIQLKATPEATEYDELPLEQTGGSREWSIRLPASVIQNGLWYRVLGNDAQTPLHQITVRSRPVVRGFEATYVYPPYLRMKDETDQDPRLMAYKGTEVTLLVKTNRQLRRGWLQLDGEPTTRPAEILNNQPDTMRFRLALLESGSYRVGFVSADDEPSEPTAPYPIKVIEDQPPTVIIDRPTEDTVLVPLNGRLELDASFSDDFGLGQITLRLRGMDNGEGYDLKAIKHRNHEPLPVGADGSLPRSYKLKQTLNIADIKYPNGKPTTFTPGQMIDYWFEATDNCELPKPNVGRSIYKRIKFTEAQTNEDDLIQQKKDAAQRNAEEKKFQAEQDQQLKQAKRPPEQLRPQDKKEDQPQQGDPQEGQPGEGQPGGQKKEGATGQGQPQAGEPKKGDPQGDKQEGAPGEGQPKSAGEPKEDQPKTGEPMNKEPGTPSGDKTPGSKAAGGEQQPKAGSPEQQPETAPAPKGGEPTTEQKQRDQQLDQQAKELQRKLDQQKQEDQQFGSARKEDGQRPPETAPMPKPNPGGEPTPKGTEPPKGGEQPKGSDTPMSQPKGGDKPPPGESKPEPKAGGDQKPGEGAPSQQKPQPGQGGQQPPDQTPGQSKPEPGPGSPGSPPAKNELSRNREKPPMGELSRETGKDGQ